MAWTYEHDFTIPSDIVRMRIGDTESHLQLLQDEEIDWLISEQPDLYLAAAEACEAIAAKFAKRVDISIVGQSASLGAKMKAYRELADRLRVESGRHGGSGTVPVAGVSAANPDFAQVEPFFTRGQFDYQGAS